MRRRTDLLALYSTEKLSLEWREIEAGKSFALGMPIGTEIGMDSFLLIGAALGAAIGLIHAPLIFRNRLRDGHASTLKAAYFGVCCFLLWVLFGPYLLFFWIAGALFLPMARRGRPRGETA
jgi:hypothetical protein